MKEEEKKIKKDKFSDPLSRLEYLYSRNKGNKREDTKNREDTNNVYSIRTKNENFLIVFAENGCRQENYFFPGSQRQAECSAFETDLILETAWVDGEISPICSIVQRRDIRKSGDVEVRSTLGMYPMNAYLCCLDDDDTADEISNQIINKLNQYAANQRNHMKPFFYIKELTEGFTNDDLHALDFWLLTMDIVRVIDVLYKDELQDDSFYMHKGLIDGLFERKENADDVRATINKYK